MHVQTGPKVMVRLLLMLLVLVPLCASGQELSSVRTRWGDAFVEWELFVYAPMEEPLEEGEDHRKPFLGK